MSRKQHSKEFVNDLLETAAELDATMADRRQGFWHVLANKMVEKGYKDIPSTESIRSMYRRLVNKGKAKHVETPNLVIKRVYANTQKVLSNQEVEGIKLDKKKMLWLLTPEERKLKGIQRVVGVIPDTHLPYQVGGALDFIVETFIKHKVTDVVHIGDIVDIHAVSVHGFSPNGDSPLGEFEQTMIELNKWYQVFPRLKYCLGNHDTRVQRVANKAGIPTRFILSFKELFKLPDEWEVAEFHVIDGVRYEHGLRVGGADAAVGHARLNMRSTVIGHLHSQSSVKYINNGETTIFGMSTGALVDDKREAFAYGKYSKHKTVLSLGIVKSSVEAYIIPLEKNIEV